MAWSDAARAAALEARRRHAKSKFETAQTRERDLRYALSITKTKRPKSGGIGGIGRLLEWQKKVNYLSAAQKQAARALARAGKAYYKVK